MLQASAMSASGPLPDLMLTPPITPSKVQASLPTSISLSPTATPNEPRLYVGNFTLLRSIGTGAWSRVSAAEEIYPVTSTKRTEPITPPSTPRTSSENSRVLIAVKSPNQKMAHAVLLREAQVLAHLSSLTFSSKHIIAFLGFHRPTSSLVMALAPTTLKDHLSSVTIPANSASPILGMQTWLHLVYSLVDSLAWIHAAGYAHGDIKPHNILLVATSSALEPRFCDFSSSRSLSAPPVPRMDALTPKYSSPELLKSLRSRDAADSTPTAAADVWALGATLLQAATGEPPYAVSGGGPRMIAMATQGLIWEGVGGEAVGRCRRESVVYKVLKGALRRVEERVGVGEWRVIVREVREGELG